VVVKRLRVLLADQQLRVLIQKRLKRCTVSLQEAQATAFRERQQLHFDFWDLEPFRRMRVHQRITYPNGKLVEYVEYNRSLEWQRLRSIEHLRRGIDADTAQCDAEVAANDFLHRLVERHGDLPAEKLAELWLQEQDGEETANA
jgi:hypothetical protein